MINFYYVDHPSASSEFPVNIFPSFSVSMSTWDLSMYPGNRIPEFLFYEKGNSSINLRERTPEVEKDSVMPADIPAPWKEYMPDILSFHMHKYCEITRVCNAPVLYIVDRKAIQLNPGDIIFLNNYIPHAWLSGGDQMVYAQEISFTPSTLFSPDDFGPDSIQLYYFMKSYLRYCHLSADDPKNQKIFNAYDTILSEHKHQDYGYQLIIKSQLLCMFAELSRLSPQNANFSSIRFKNIHPTIKAALSYIADNLSNNITLGDVAKYCYMSPPYFSSVFKKEVGISFLQYLTRQRIEKSRDMLVSSQYSVTEIALQCGFSSVSNFYRAFHSIYGMSPNQMRNTIQPPPNLNK